MTNDYETRRALRLIARLWGVGIAVTLAVSAVIYLTSVPPSLGGVRTQIAGYLRENGFWVQEKDIVVAGGLASSWRDEVRPVVFLGARPFGRRLDLWVARMKLSPAGAPLSAQFENLSSTFLHNEKAAAVSESWVFWPSPEKAGRYYLAWLPNVEWRLQLDVSPQLESPRLYFQGNVAVLEGLADGKPALVRIVPESRRMSARGVRARLDVVSVR